MKAGFLSDYFEGAAAKRLSAVEADLAKSNQHEFNATKRMLEFLGRPEEKITIPARFMYLNDEDPEPLLEDAFLTFGNRRKGKPRAPEYRLYFPRTAVTAKASTGDLLVLAKLRDGSLLMIIAENNSSIASQIIWLFGLEEGLASGKVAVRTDLDGESNRIQLASRQILESIGIETDIQDTDYLEEMLDKFDQKFPKTREFSEYARSTLPDISIDDDPDHVLMAWLEQEEILFRTLEHYMIAERLYSGFFMSTKSIKNVAEIAQNTEGQIRQFMNQVDVDGFISFSLSVQNRRKSRVGLALENHLEAIFAHHKLKFSRTAVTENRTKPDFLFPGAEEYHDASFDATYLLMLGVKSTCKDRWRQVLAEADRISQKHLLTLEPSISMKQTDEMASKNLRLVLPEQIHETYSDNQQAWLMNLNEFMSLVKEKQFSVTNTLF